MQKRFASIASIVLVCVMVAGFAVAFSFDNRASGNQPESPDTPGVHILSEETVAVLAETTTFPFGDVGPHDWFYNSVVWAYRNEIMNGTSSTVFSPHSNMTRAMLVTVLWRYAGSPPAGNPAFIDVAANRWYSTAVAWANENDIVHGHNAFIFGVNEPVTREQMYTILYRYMIFAELTINLDDEPRILRFEDEEEISDWALDAMYLMYDAGIMFAQGTLDRSARPRVNAFRGEVAGAMYFFDLYSEPISVTMPGDS